MTRTTPPTPPAMHTPGPWQATRTYTDKRDPTFSHQDVLDASGTIRVAVVSGVGMDRAKANARLIAAAPALLAEVTRLREGYAAIMRMTDQNDSPHVPPWSRLDDVRTVARAALAGGGK